MGAEGGRPRVVIAVDFGTTFSGFAYARTSDPESVFKVYEWPGADKASAKPYSKTQTSLFYAARPGAGVDDPFELVEWGWNALVAYTQSARNPATSQPVSSTTVSSVQISNLLSDHLLGCSLSARSHSDGTLSKYSHVVPLHSRLEAKAAYFATKFKLFLAPDSHDNVPALPGGLTVEQMITDYLRSLAKFIMSELKLNYGKLFSIEEVQWCLTVPAIWDEKAKQVMKVCAEKANMVQGASSPKGAQPGSPFALDIILEPEAASVYCQHKAVGLKLVAGDKLLVADVGGGTIDLVVHEKADNASMMVHEVVASYGALGGGTFVDNNFFEHLCQKIGCFKEFSRNNSSIVLGIYKWWQGVKAGFDGEGFSAELTLPRKLSKAWQDYDKSLGLNREDEEHYDELRLTDSEIMAIFRSEVEKVLSLINREIEGVRVLMIVGGFSASQYLRKRVQRTFESRVDEIIIPEDPGSAICHGALQLHFKRDIIQSRIAKSSYGILTDMDAKPHDPSDLLYKDDDGSTLCRDCVDVFVRAGDRVPLDASITQSYVPVYHRQREILIELVSSRNRHPMYTSDADVVKEGSFSVDMSEDMHLDKARCVDVTMVFGASLLIVSAERANFGLPGKERGLSVVFEKG